MSEGFYRPWPRTTARAKYRMIAYMNAENLEKTLKTGIVHYFSRSRNELWKKGEPRATSSM